MIETHLVKYFVTNRLFGTNFTHAKILASPMHMIAQKGLVKECPKYEDILEGNNI